MNLLLVLALLAQPGSGCDPNAKKAASDSHCPYNCICVYPGKCGHLGCDCKMAAGVKSPPKEEWRPFTANPVYEVYGKEWNGVFRYTHYRLKGTAAVYAVQPRA